ncbi:MAG: flagellar hook assembly protein FlgD [Syntrophobacterales bacterium]|nr:flagellar hook assembly protein FlgD [Syntrophobacterales bacterium]
MPVSAPYILGVPPFLAQDKTLIDLQKNKALDLEAFLKMFTTQLQHQDPMNPLKSHELAAQLAQFSTVEQLIRANQYLEEGAKYLFSINNLETVELIDKYVKGFTDVIVVKDGAPKDLNFTLDTGGVVTVNIYDQSGKLIRVLDKGKVDRGSHAIGWDGLDNQGRRVPDGDYRVEVVVVTESGRRQVIYPDAKGKATSLRFVNGLPYLVLDNDEGLKMPAGYVIQIWSDDPVKTSGSQSNI